MEDRHTGDLRRCSSKSTAASSTSRIAPRRISWGDGRLGARRCRTARGRTQGRRGVEPGVAGPLPEPDRGGRSGSERRGHPRRRACAPAGRRGRRGPGPRRGGRGAARIADHDQGHHRDRGAAHDGGCTLAGGARSGPGRHRRRPPEGRRGHRVRQDELPPPTAATPRARTWCSARPATRGTPADHRAVRRAARPQRWPPDRRRWNSAATSGARCGTRRTTAASTGTSPASASSRPAGTSPRRRAR